MNFDRNTLFTLKKNVLEKCLHQLIHHIYDFFLFSWSIWYYNRYNVALQNFISFDLSTYDGKTVSILWIDFDRLLSTNSEINSKIMWSCTGNEYLWDGRVIEISQQKISGTTGADTVSFNEKHTILSSHTICW